MSALDFFACIQGFKLTIDPRMNQRFDIIKRYINANPNAIFTVNSSDCYLFKFLISDPGSLDRFDRIIAKNSSPLSTLFDIKNPKPISSPIASIFYCREFFKTYTRNAELVYNMWRSFNPSASQISKFREVLKTIAVDTDYATGNANIEKFKTMLDIPSPIKISKDDIKKAKGNKAIIDKIKAQQSEKGKSLSSETDINLLLYIKKKIFLVGDNKFRSNIADIERAIDLFELVCNIKSNKSNDDTNSTSGSDDNESPNKSKDIIKILNILTSADKEDQVAKGLSEIIKQVDNKLKAAESNTELSDDLKNIQKALISILKK